jgi:hypothetical protein
MDAKLKQQIEDAKKLLEKYAPKGEFLAYINKDEAKLLMAAGGSGLPVKQTGIPSFIPWLAIAVGASAGISLLGSYNQRKMLKRAAKADGRRAAVAAIQQRIQANERAALILSEKRAAQAARGIAMGEGSSLLEMNTVVDNLEDSLYWIDKGLTYDLNEIDFRLAGALSENAAKMGQTLVSAIATGYQVSGSTAQPTTTTGLTSGSLFGAGKR